MIEPVETENSAFDSSLILSNYNARFKFKNDGCDTRTSQEQRRVEDAVEECYKIFLLHANSKLKHPSLLRDPHISYLNQTLRHLPASYESLDASGPWIVFWALHSLEILNEPLNDKLIDKIATYLNLCQHKKGGYGGGPGQFPHVATTYAAVMALSILNSKKAYDSIDRPGLYAFLKSCVQEDGSVVMQDGGETDIRGAYCVAAVAVLTNILDEKLFEKTPQWLADCQTYEGGFAAYPGCEAHGGYTFCGLATLILLGRENLCDLERLLRWVAFKQLPFEGGFQGRTNKLVDACYSYWQGASFPLIEDILKRKKGDCSSYAGLFNTEALTNYLLICCQRSGGMVDKPGKSRDLYHTCYALSGLCVAQNYAKNLVRDELSIDSDLENLANIDPLFNVSVQSVENAKNYFSSAN